jgi:hypothetical protein
MSEACECTNSQHICGYVGRVVWPGRVASGVEQARVSNLARGARTVRCRRGPAAMRRSIRAWGAAAWRPARAEAPRTPWTTPPRPRPMYEAQGREDKVGDGRCVGSFHPTGWGAAWRHPHTPITKTLRHPHTHRRLYAQAPPIQLPSAHTRRHPQSTYTAHKRTHPPTPHPQAGVPCAGRPGIGPRARGPWPRTGPRSTGRAHGARGPRCQWGAVRRDAPQCGSGTVRRGGARRAALQGQALRIAARAHLQRVAVWRCAAWRYMVLQFSVAVWRCSLALQFGVAQGDGAQCGVAHLEQVVGAKA